MESYNSGNALKVIKTIHFAIIGGALIFSVLVLLIISPSDPQLIDLDNPLSFLPIVFAAVLIPLSFFLFNSTLRQNLEGKSELSQKIAAFQTAHIIKIALLEGGSLFGIVASLSSNTYTGLVVFVVLLCTMLLSTPSVLKLADKLSLTREEISSFEG